MIPADRGSATTSTRGSAFGSPRHGKRTCDYPRCLHTLIGDALCDTALSGDRPIPVFRALASLLLPLSGKVRPLNDLVRNPCVYRYL